MDWIKCNYDDVCIDTPVRKYREFTIALAIPNGGIIGVSIWNWNKSIVETLDTEDYNKYSDADWHITHAVFRINKILEEVPSKKYSFLEKFHINKLRFILKYHNIPCENKRYARGVVKAIENSDLSIQEIWDTLKQYRKKPNLNLSDLPLFNEK